MADDLVSRLSETLEEAERRATAADDGSWQLWRAPFQKYRLGINTVRAGIDIYAPDKEVGEAVGQYLQAFGPQAVLRLVAAHREVIEKYRTAQTTVEASDGTVLAGAMKINRRAYLEVIKLLAAGWGITEEGR